MFRSAASSESPAQHDQHISMSHQTPEWAERLKGQTVVEDTLEGRPNRAAMVDQQHERIMHQMAKDPQAQQVSTGMYNSMTMLHQYGAGNQDMLLMSDPRTEPVSQGGRCPANAPVRQYNVVGDQCRNHAQSVAGFLSGLHVRIDRKYGEGPRRRGEKQGGAREGRLRSRRGHQRRAEPSGFSPSSFAAIRATASRSSCKTSLKAAKTSACISMAPA